MLLAFIVGISYMGLGFVTPLQTLYGRQMGATSAEIGLIAAAPLLTGFLAAPLLGHAIDYFGCRAVLCTGLSLHAFLFLTYGFVHIPFWLIMLRAIEGLAIVCILPPARTLMNTLAPHTRQAEALGLLSATQMGGTLIGPLCGTLLATQVGFLSSFLSASVTLEISSIIAIFFLPPNAPPSSLKTTIIDPQFLSKDLFTHPLLLAYTLKGVLSASQGVILAIWSIYMQMRGASLFLIGLTWALYSLPIMLITPFAGRYSDSRGRFLPIAFGLIAYSIIYSLYGLSPPLLWIVIVSFLEGIIAATVLTALDGFLADNMLTHKRGSTQAIFETAGNIGSFLAAIAAGLLYTLSPGAPFFMMGILFLFIAALVLFPNARHLLTRSQRPSRSWQNGLYNICMQKKHRRKRKKCKKYKAYVRSKKHKRSKKRR